MGFLLACMTNRADRLQDVFKEESGLLQHAPRESNGWGLGFYQSGEVLHKKHPQPTKTPIDWVGAFGGVRSHCVIAHARAREAQNCSAFNTHPFRMRQWLFAQHGAVDRFEAVRESLLETMPDFIQRNIRGDTDSEYLFHAILSFVHDNGQLDSPEAQDQAVTTAIRSGVRLVDRLVAERGGQPAVLNLVLTNGRRMYALKRGAPMSLAVRDGAGSGFAAGSGIAGADAAAQRGSPRYVLLASGIARAPEGAPGGPTLNERTLEDGTMVIVDRDLGVTQQPL